MTMKWNMGWMNDFTRLHVVATHYFRKGDLRTAVLFSMLYAYSEDFVLVLSHDEVVHGKGSMIGKMPGETYRGQGCKSAGGLWLYDVPSGKEAVVYGTGFCPIY